MKRTALIMAGGRGERFWPKSRADMPKQFLSLTDNGKTMIQLTVERILPLVDICDIFIVTSHKYKELVKKQLPDLPIDNIICEPMSRNTAPCIGLGSLFIEKKYDDALVYVLPSDHLVTHPQIFRRTLTEATKIAELGENLVTIGITPTYPETGYGYIKICPEETIYDAYKVDCFVEKPNAEIARDYVASQQFLWNSGMFIWKASTILSNMKQYMPETYNGLLKIKAAIGTKEQDTVIEKEYTTFRSESIDYGVMEKASNIFILSGSFGWDDMGSWLALGRMQPCNEFGNIISGNVISINTKNTIIQGEDKLIATVGLENLVIIDTKDAMLICDKNCTADIKKIIENLKICNRMEYL